MENSELLLTSSQGSQQVTTCLWDYGTTNLLKVYKNGGTAAPKTLNLIGQDYLLTAEAGKPLLNCWNINSQDINKSIRLILPSAANCAKVCPKNAYLAVGLENKLYIWHMCSGKLVSLQQKHYQPVTCLQFSSDGEFLVIGGEDGLLVVYYLASLVAIQHSLLSQSKIGQVEPLYTRHDHSMPIKDLHIGAFGRHSRLATVSLDQTCRMYDLQTGQQILTLVFSEPLTTVVFDNPCWQLYVGAVNGIIYHCSLNNPPKTSSHHVEKDTSREFVGHQGKIVALKLNCTNTVLASGAEDSFVYTWDLQSRQILQKFQHKGPITDLKFVPNFSTFFKQNFKPNSVIKNIQHSLDTTSSFVMSLPNEEIEFSDDENTLLKEKSRHNLETENIDLRVTNYKLYKAFLEMKKML